MKSFSLIILLCSCFLLSCISEENKQNPSELISQIINNSKINEYKDTRLFRVRDDLWYLTFQDKSLAMIVRKSLYHINSVPDLRVMSGDTATFLRKVKETMNYLADNHIVAIERYYYPDKPLIEFYTNISDSTYDELMSSNPNFYDSRTSKNSLPYSYVLVYIQDPLVLENLRKDVLLNHLRENWYYYRSHKYSDVKKEFHIFGMKGS